MIVFYKERLVLLSVPKTGSTAFQSALQARADVVVSGPPELKHAPLRRYDRFINAMFTKVMNAELEVMAVVREPIDWLGSWYRYRRRPSLDGKPTSTGKVNFDEFVRAYLMRDNQPAFAHVGSQAKFLSPRPGGAEVSYLFKYDHQQKLIEFLENRLKIKIDTPQINISPTMPLILREETEHLLRRSHSEDFDLYQSAM